MQMPIKGETVTADLHAYLSNPIYAALTTADAPFSVVNGVARRFQPDTIPFAAIPEPGRDALQDLSQLLSPGEEVWMTLDEGQTLPIIPGLELVGTLASLQMDFVGDLPSEDDPAVIQLTQADAESMFALKALAYPGFFGTRAAELGSFFGIRDAFSGELVAMGGERLATNDAHEISAVCTHPQHSGKGYAARIMRAVLSHQARQGVRSFLHVAAANSRAISLYEHLHFRKAGDIHFVQLKKLMTN